MSYRIEYQATKKVRGLEKRTAVLPALAGCLVLSLLLVSAFWPRGREMMERLLIPGDPAVTAAALEELSEDLQSGESIQDALDAFCRQVLVNDTP